MSKLREDQISWVLNLDAKGVQGEVQKLSNSIRGLKDENKFLKNEMRDANKQMSDAEKEMKKLEKAGRMHSKAYKEARGTYEGAKDEIAAYKTQLEKNNKTIDQHNKKLDTTIKTMRIEDMTMAQLRKRAGELQGQLNHTSMAADPKKYKELQTELTKVQGRMGDVKSANQSLGQQLGSIPGPAGAAVKGLQGVGTAMKALIMNPVGIIIMAIVGAFLALKKALNSSEEAMFKFQQLLAPIGALLDWLLSLLQKAVIGIIDGITKAINWIMKMAERLPLVGKFVQELNEKAAVAIELEKAKQELEKRRRAFTVKDAETEKQVAELRNKAKQKDIYTEQERLNMIEEAIKLERERADEKMAIAEENYRIMAEEAARAGNTTETERMLAEAQAEKHRAETEFYRTTTRLASEKATLVEQIEKEWEEAHKKHIEAQEKREEGWLQNQKQRYKKMLLANQISRADYDKAMEQAEMQSLENRLRIAGLEPEKRAQIEQQLLDMRLAANDRADKAMLDALKKEQENQKKILAESHQFTLEQLREQETDKALLAVKTAAIEQEFAQKRLELAQSFGQALQQTEFHNAELQQEAIAENSEAIVAADNEANKARLAAKKTFAEQAAALEASLHVETLEERQNRELATLERLHQAGLLSEETYQLALKGIETKYNEERFRARQEWGLTTLAEVHQREMDILKEQYAAKMLSEEEFEQAKLQLKLNYAQQYTQQAQQLAQAGANALNAIQDAQIARAGDDEAKKLEIQKKFADAQFAMQVAQIVGSTAQGIMSAWASAMTLGPIAGPIAGAALAALIGATGVAQVAVANAERQRIKSLTLGGGGGGGASTPTASPTAQASMVLNQGFADGGYTGAGGKYEVAGMLPDGRPYHRGEYFVAQEEMTHPEVVPLVRRIEQVRRRRTSTNPLPEGFAEGGYSGNNIGKLGIESILSRVADLLDYLKNNPIEAEINYIGFKDAEKRIEQSKENTSL